MLSIEYNVSTFSSVHRYIATKVYMNKQATSGIASLLLPICRLVEKQSYCRDFRQTLLVIPKGSREDIVSINASYLWPFCKVLTLSKNKRLNISSNAIENARVQRFSEQLLQIGDGVLGDTSESEGEVEIPDDILIQNSDFAFDELTNFVYPEILSNLTNVNYFKQRFILVPTLEVVAHVNNHIIVTTKPRS